MTFLRANPAGWLAGDPILFSQMNPLDIDHSNAIDGANGGTYSPTADIDFPGAFGPKWGATRYPKMTLRDEYRLVSLIRMGEILPAGGTSWSLQGNGTSWRQTSVASDALLGQETMIFSVDNMIAGAQLKGARVWLQGAAGHGGALPVLPTLAVYREALGTQAIVGSQNDTSINAAAYEALHYIDLAFAAEGALDESAGTRYTALLYGEGMTNGIVGLDVFAIYTLWDCSSIRPGG